MAECGQKPSGDDGGYAAFPLRSPSASSASQTRPIVVDRWQPVGVAIAQLPGNLWTARGAAPTSRDWNKKQPSGSSKVSKFTILRTSMGLQTERPSSVQQTQRPRIWWSNGTVFVATHIAAAIGCYFHPFHSVPRSTLILCFVLFQFAEFSSVNIRSCDALLAHHFLGQHHYRLPSPVLAQGIPRQPAHKSTRSLAWSQRDAGFYQGEGHRSLGDPS